MNKEHNKGYICIPPLENSLACGTTIADTQSDAWVGRSPIALSL